MVFACLGALCGGVTHVFLDADGVATTASSSSSSRQLLQITTLPPESPSPDNVTDSSDSSNFPYPEVFFSFEQMRQGAVLLCLAGVVYMFAGLAIVCDDYFVPALELLSERLELSEDVAGATFMAAGGSAPELFTSFVAVFIAKSDVGFGTIVGSAVFNILFVIGFCAVATRHLDPKGLPLTWWPLFRDSSFYSVALMLLAIFFRDHRIEWYESLSLLLLYGVYVLFMKFNNDARKRAWHWTGLNWNSLSAEIMKDDPSKDHEMQNKNEGGGGGGSEEEEEGEPWTPGYPEGSIKDKLVGVVLSPLNFALWLTVPNCQREEKKHLYVAGFLLSIVWIAIFSYFMVWWAEVSSRSLHMPSTVMGLTVLAAGTSVPDLITSVIVAKKGHGDMAVSSSIGSNMFDVTLGLPLPWFLWSVIHGGESVVVESSSLTASVIMLFIMYVLFLDCF